MNFDIAIVGLGPAGIFAINELIDEKLYNYKIVAIDKGGNIDERCEHIENQDNGYKLAKITEGFGGAGFFVDGKLCFDPKAGSRFENEAIIYSKIEKKISTLLNKIGVEITKSSPEPLSDTIQNSFRSNKLECEAYPVQTLGSDVAKLVAKEFYTDFIAENRVTLRLLNEVTSIKLLDDGKFGITLLRQNDEIERISTKYLILAPGIPGFEWMAQFASLNNLKTLYNNVNLGFRIEFSGKVGKRIYETLGANPKIKKFYDTTYCKTHCFCNQGEVIQWTNSQLQSVVDGHTYNNVKLDNANINVLCNISTEIIKNPVLFARNLIANLNNQSSGKVILQRLDDLRKRRASRKSGITENKIKPSLEDTHLGDLSLIYPEFIIHHLIDFIDQINNVFEGFGTSDVLIYGPAVQWDVQQLVINEISMESPIPNLYVAGDATGKTQGVLSAAYMGVKAAEHIKIKWVKK